MFVDRLLWLLAALLLTATIFYLWPRYNAYRLTRRARRTLPPELISLVAPGRPALLYFTTPDCTQCRLRQAPILAQLRALAAETKNDLSIYTLDALQHEGLARFFGIMTVPTTVWLDADRRPVAVNHGLATLNQLQRQFPTA
jgi:thioredoxin 1